MNIKSYLIGNKILSKDDLDQLNKEEMYKSIKVIMDRYLVENRDFTRNENHNKCQYVVDMLQEIQIVTGLPFDKLNSIDSYCAGSADYDRKLRSRIVEAVLI